MSELMSLLTGIKPYPIPACAIRPFPFPNSDEVEGHYCGSCHRTKDDQEMHVRRDGKVSCICLSCQQKRVSREKKCA